jgi:hypothetical protein
MHTHTYTHSHQSYTGVPWGVDSALLRLQTEGVLDDAPLPFVVAVWNTQQRMEEYMPPVMRRPGAPPSARSPAQQL